MQALQRDNAYPTGEWYAVAINDSGLIGGHVIAATNQSFPYYWPNKSSAPVKITMPAGFPYGEIYGINASGQMVGIMWSTDQAGATEHAFIFDTQNGVRDLNNLIDPASGWVLHFARDINNDGHIAGYGEKNGQKRGALLASLLVPPPSPILVSTPNGSVQNGTSVTFSWSTVPGATSYDLYLRDSSGTIFDRWLGNVTSYTVTGLPNDGRVIYWSVYPGNAAGTGTPSETRSFINGAVSVPPSAPTLVSPTAGSAQAGTSVTFRWNAVTGATSYDLYLRDSSGTIFDRWLGNVTSYTVMGLPNDGRVIYWSVYPGNAAGTGTPSETRSFINGTVSVPPASPTLISPATGSAQAGSSVTFAWSAAPGATDYDLYVRDSSGTIFDRWLGNVTSYTVTGLPNDGRVVYWSVYPGNAAGTGAPSETRSFVNGN